MKSTIDTIQRMQTSRTLLSLSLLFLSEILALVVSATLSAFTPAATQYFVGALIAMGFTFIGYALCYEAIQ